MQEQFYYVIIHIVEIMKTIYDLLIIGNKTHFMFGIQCGFIGFLVLIVDSIVSYLNKTDNKSLLGIRYSRKNLFQICLSWVVGASIMGFLGSFFQLLADTKQAMGSIGISWPLIFSKLVETIGDKDDTNLEDENEEEELDEADNDLDGE